MAEIDYLYNDAVHTIDTYDNVLISYNWICDALHMAFPEECLNIRCHVSFSSNELTYNCKSIEEFKKYAFGKETNVQKLHVLAYDNDFNGLVDVYAAYHKNSSEQVFHLTSNDEMRIVCLKESLCISKDATLNDKENIVMHIEDNSIHIGNDNQISNSVFSSKNISNIENVNKSTSIENKESLLSKSFWQILVPILVGIIVVVICACIGLDN